MAEAMVIDNFIRMVRVDKMVSHLILESVPTDKVDEIFGDDKDSVVLEIIVNGHKVSAEPFINALTKNYRGFYDETHEDLKRAAKKYIDETLVPSKKLEKFEELIGDMIRTAELLKQKVDSSDKSFEWGDKALERVNKEYGEGLLKKTEEFINGDKDYAGIKGSRG